MTTSSVAFRLPYYRDQAQLCRLQADHAVGSDRSEWLRMAGEWQRLHDIVSRELGHDPEDWTRLQPP